MKIRKLGPIDFLLTRNFDQFCINYALGRVKDSAMAVQLHGEPTPQIVEKIRAEYATLQALSPDELKRRYEEASDQFAAEEKRKLQFSKENAQADFEYWARAAYWTIEEGVLLIMGRDPRRVQVKSIAAHRRTSRFARRFVEVSELAERALKMHQLNRSNTPGEFVAWAKQIKLEIDPELERALESFGVEIANWASRYHFQTQRVEKLDSALQERDKFVGDLAATITLLTKKIEELEAACPRHDTLGQKERTSLLKLVIGMAVGTYAFDPHKDRNSATKEIADDLEQLGIALDRGTILKWLNEGANHLPRDVPED